MPILLIKKPKKKYEMSEYMKRFCEWQKEKARIIKWQKDNLPLLNPDYENEY